VESVIQHSRRHRSTPLGHKPICVPVASEGQYRASGDAPAQYRQYLGEMLRQYPELFPQEMDPGVPLHDRYVSIKQDLIMRRITWQTTKAVCTLRPSCVMPSMMARTDAGEKALSLRQGGDPLTPWPRSVAAMPGAGLAPGWPAAARRWSAPPCKTRPRCPALWGPMSS
jgi:hypothetical protein